MPNNTNSPSFNSIVFGDYAYSIESFISMIMRRELFTIDMYKVKSISEDRKFVDILPVLKNATTNGKEIEITDNDTVYNIPIMMPFGGSNGISYSLDVGDIGILLSCKFDISNFKKEKTDSVIASSRFYNKANGVFIPLDFNSIVSSGFKIFSGNTFIHMEHEKIKIETENMEILSSQNFLKGNSLDLDISSFSCSGKTNVTNIFTANEIHSLSGSTGTFENSAGHQLIIRDGIITNIIKG